MSCEANLEIPGTQAGPNVIDVPVATLVAQAGHGQKCKFRLSIGVINKSQYFAFSSGFMHRQAFSCTAISISIKKQPTKSLQNGQTACK